MLKRITSFFELLEIELPKLPTLRNRLANILNLSDMQRAAHRRLPRFVYDYIAGSAFREQAAKWNEEALQRVAFRPRVLAQVGSTTTAQTFLGAEYGMPVGIAPTGLTALTHPDAELAGARAAAAHNVPFVLSTMSTYSIEDVAAAAPNAERWFQLYLRKDRSESLELIERAAAAGYSKLVWTVDTAIGGHRLRDTRNGLSLPPKLTMKTAIASALHPAWALRFLQQDAPSLANFAGVGGSMSKIVGQMFEPDQSWDDFDLIRKAWKGDLIVKGVLDPADAAEFVARGANAIWVSNHGGRQLDRAIAPIEAVGAIREAVGADVPIVLDSGITSGSDVLAALGAGADFTFIGRSYLYGLATGGQAGVERVLEILRTEMQNSLQLLGVRGVHEVDQSFCVDTAQPAATH